MFKVLPFDVHVPVVLVCAKKKRARASECDCACGCVRLVESLSGLVSFITTMLESKDKDDSYSRLPATKR